MATEKQYIDPNELKAMVNGDIDRCYQLRIDGVGALSHFLDQINSCKTVNAVEVVHCKDCESHHWEQEPCHGKTVHLCKKLNAEVTRDFYCAAGIRRTDDGNG